MKRIVSAMVTTALFGSILLANSAILSGYLRDDENGEALIGATVYIEELEKGVVTNPYGFYSISLPDGTYKVSFSYIGYGTETVEIDLNSNQQVSLKLSESSQTLDEVVVTGEQKNRNVESLDVSTEKMPVKMVKKLPSFMGEVDIIKTIQLLPGIQSGGEGSSGLYVRGGGPDENLVLLDEAPVYNASHLMGFFSVFNADAIKDIQVYKGGIPSQYGGRASSVIDVRMKDGNSQHFEVDGGIGNISSRLTVQGPIIKDKWSFIVSGRRTYADILFRPFVEALEDNSLYFYDLNGKTNIKLSDKDRLYISAYTGDDAFSLGESLYMKWGNLTTTARWSHVFGQKLFSNTSFIYSLYNYNMGVPEGSMEFDWSSQIRDYNIKSDFGWYLNPQNKINFGLNVIHHNFQPGSIDGGEESFFSEIELTQYNALENAVYLSNEQHIGSRLSVDYGVRLSIFQQIGEGEVRNYANADAPNENDTLGVNTYKNGELIGAPFTHLEPRISLKYSLGTTSSIKASYNRMVQNLHLISNTSSPTPLDIWLPSNKYIDPLLVDQYVLGYFRNFKDDAIETSVEVYYKDMQNVLDYKPGAQLFLRENIETEFLSGTGYSYGLELMAKKQQGDFTGWIGYTLSRTMRKVEGIRNGDPYPSAYDRTHDVSVVMNYEINDNWNVSGNWVFATGNPTTYPAGKYVIQGMTNYSYTDFNSYRLPSYHRMDLSLTYDFEKNKTRRFKQSLNLSLYNVYRRRNAYSITYRQNEDNPNISEAVRLSIIGDIIPAVTYNVKF